MGSPKQDEGQAGEQQIGDPGAQPGREQLVPTEGLSGFDAAVIGEAQQHAQAEAVSQPGTACVGTESCAEGDDDEAGKWESDLKV